MRRRYMNIERCFDTHTRLTLQQILQSLIEEKIDSLITEYYYQDKVNTTTSHKKGEENS